MFSLVPRFEAIIPLLCGMLMQRNVDLLSRDRIALEASSNDHDGLPRNASGRDS